MLLRCSRMLLQPWNIVHILELKSAIAQNRYPLTRKFYQALESLVASVGAPRRFLERKKEHPTPTIPAFLTPYPPS